jgi:hypothetical protein
VLSPACDTWTISWSTCCRATINNVVSGNNTMLALYAPINTQTNTCNNSPSFVDRYTPYLCVNETHNIRFIATDLEGDSLVYSLVPALASSGPVSYVTGLSGTEQMAGMTIASNPFSGSTRIEVAGTDEYDLVVFDIAGEKKCLKYKVFARLHTSSIVKLWAVGCTSLGSLLPR